MARTKAKLSDGVRLADYLALGLLAIREESARNATQRREPAGPD